MRSTTLFLTIAAAAGALLGATPRTASAQPLPGIAPRAAHAAAPLSGSRLEEFRRLADELDVSATLAHETARRDLWDNRLRGQQFLGELNYFAVQSRGLHDRADAGPVHPQQMGPAVDGLLEEARQADRRMRDARVFESVWNDSGRTITILQRMARLVRP